MESQKQTKNIIKDIKEAKTQKQKQNTKPEIKDSQGDIGMTMNQHFYILTTSSKLPKTVSNEIFAKFKKTYKNIILYNDIEDIYRLSANSSYIDEINRDKTKYINTFMAYFDVSTIEELKTAYNETMNNYKKAKIDNPKQTLKDYDEELFKVISEANKIKQKYNPHFHKYFKFDDKVAKVEAEKAISKVSSYDDLIKSFQNSEYIIVINTLSKDFKYFIQDIKKLVDYGQTYKKLWLICDLNMYKLINIEGIELKPNKEYLIKF